MLPRTRRCGNVVATAALDFLRRGFCPIAVNSKTKIAAQDWKQYQTERPNEHEVVRMFDGVDEPGLALVMGPVSNNLYARDFDSMVAYDAWAKTYPELSSGFLPTVSTNRGMHVWFRSEAVLRAKTIEGLHEGEIKGLGSYALAPPTIGKSGRPYQFVHPINDEIPIVNVADAGLDRRWLLGGNSASETQEVYKYSCVSLPSCVSLFVGDANGPTSEAIVDVALRSTIPAVEGVRHQKIFEFIRILKASPALASRPAPELEPIFRQWFDRAIGTISTKSWEISWADFRSGWAKANSAAFDDPRVAFELARQCPHPPCAARYHDPKTRDLVRLLYIMQAFAGDKPFFLGCRLAGKLLGLPHATANRHMLKLQHDGVLVAVVKHDLEERSVTGKRMAYEYKFIGDASDSLRMAA